MNAIKSTVKLSEAKADFGKLVRLANKSSEPICIADSNPNKDVVLISRKEYERRIAILKSAVAFFDD